MTIRIPLDGSVPEGVLRANKELNDQFPRSIFSLTQEQRAEVMAKNPPVISDIFYAGAMFNWQWSGCGFGQLSFSHDKETGKLTVSDEYMGKERVRALLYSLADHIVDHADFE